MGTELNTGLIGCYDRCAHIEHLVGHGDQQFGKAVSYLAK